MTLEAWVNPVTVNNAWTDIIYKGQYLNGNDEDDYYLEGSIAGQQR